MSLLLLGLVLFIGTHAFTMARGPRGTLVARLDEGPYKGLYSVLSLAGLVLISIGYGQYRQSGYVPIWDPPVWTRHLALPEPSTDPDWITRLLLARLEAQVRGSAGGEDEARITGLTLTLDRLTNPAARQLPAFEPQAGRWEELRWSVERIGARFGEGRLWRAVVDRPTAALPERQARLVEIGHEAGTHP